MALYSCTYAAYDTTHGMLLIWRSGMYSNE